MFGPLTDKLGGYKSIQVGNVLMVFGFAFYSGSNRNSDCTITYADEII